MHRLLFLNRFPWWARIPLKTALFLAVGLAVCFPHPGRLVTHVNRWRNPDALIEPDAPLLQPLVEEVRRKIPPDAAPREALSIVERYVYQRIPYEWDWNNWLNADYLPTVAETIERGKEDCDGRAVVAASLLRKLGFHAELVTDFAHVWVRTEQGELMGPGKQQAVVATAEGLRVKSSALAALPRALAYGIAPFPLPRELILALAAWYLLLRRGAGAGCALASLALLLDGLLFLRIGGQDHTKPIVWMQLVGLANWLMALMCLTLWARHNARQARKPAD